VIAPADLRHDRLRLTAVTRGRAMALCAVSAVISWGLWTQPQAYAAKPFQVLLDVMPLGAWATAWAFVAVMLLVAVARSSPLAWILGAGFSAGVAACWLMGLSFAHWGPLQAALSPSGFALWSWLIASLVIGMRSPAQFTKPNDGA